MSRPWYYVPGRKDLTERRLHTKREIEARRNETWSQINNYFNSCSMRCKRFNEWSKIKPASRVFSLPPYDGDFSQESMVVDQRKLQEAEVLKGAGNEIVVQISFLKETSSDLNSKMSSWMIKSRRLQFVRFTRDKLRHQVFLSFEKLSYFHELLSDICPQTVYENILNDEEGNEFKAVVQGGQNIIQIFLDLNRHRNYEIVNMFQ